MEANVGLSFNLQRELHPAGATHGSSHGHHGGHYGDRL